VTLRFRVSVDILTDAVERLQTIVNESRIRFDDTGLTSRAVGPANVAMVDISVPADCFDRLQADDAQLGVNLDTLADVLDMARADDDVIAEVNQDTRMLDIEFPKTGIEYTKALIDPDSLRQEPDIPELDLDASYTVPGRSFDRGIEAAALVSDHILIRGVDSETMLFRADGDVDDVSFRLSADDDSASTEQLVDGSMSGDGSVESMFSLEYLDDIFSPVDSDTPVTMDIGSEFPVIFNYQTESDIAVKNLVAPRIQS